MSKTIELAIGVSTTPIPVLPIPIKQPRDPDARDFGYAVGQLWFNTLTLFLWIQDGIINDVPNWILIAPATGFTQGTFTPTIQGSISTDTITYSSQVGRYQRVGRIVTANFLVVWSAIGTSSGTIICNGLPLACANAQASFYWTDYISALACGAGTCPSGVLGVGSTSWIPYAYNVTTGGNTGISITTTGGISATIIYETA